MNLPQSFRGNDWPTLGVELELQLVDRQSMALRSAIADLLAILPPELNDWVKPEFLQCYVELTSGVCRTVADVEADLAGKLRALERAADLCGVALFWAGTHPFSRWQEQDITPNDRYQRLADLLQEPIVRSVTFGMHVHVGVDTGDKAVRVSERLQEYLPLLLAFSANSPFWNGRPTGEHAHRVELLEVFPTGGLPPRMNSWDEYVALVGRLQEAGFIESAKELWWDVRPSPGYGTVEVRVCDVPCDLPAVLGLTALIQCLVKDLSDRIDAGEPAPDCDTYFVRQNRWRAWRFGPGAMLVDPVTLEPTPAREAAARLVERLRPVAERLGCAGRPDWFGDLIQRPTGSEIQLDLYDREPDLAGLVRHLVGRSRLTPVELPSPRRRGRRRAGAGGRPDAGLSGATRVQNNI